MGVFIGVLSCHLLLPSVEEQNFDLTCWYGISFVVWILDTLMITHVISLVIPIVPKVKLRVIVFCQ